MEMLKTYSDYRTSLVKDFAFTEEQITESLIMLESSDELFEYWYNTVFDFAALIPGIGSFFEGINLVSYANQGEYLLAGLCAIGLIPIFGQYIGAGGSLLVKTLRGTGKVGSKMLAPVASLVSRFFPKITKFLKSAEFTSKFKGISKHTDKMILALKDLSAGKKVGLLGKVFTARGEGKALVRWGQWLIPGGKGSQAAGGSEDPRVAATAEDNWEQFLKAVPIQTS
jgi:hypothetical protein